MPELGGADAGQCALQCRDCLPPSVWQRRGDRAGDRRSIWGSAESFPDQASGTRGAAACCPSPGYRRPRSSVWSGALSAGWRHRPCQAAEPTAMPARMGKRLFHDADFCFIFVVGDLPMGAAFWKPAIHPIWMAGNCAFCLRRWPSAGSAQSLMRRRPFRHGKNRPDNDPFQSAITRWASQAGPPGPGPAASVPASRRGSRSAALAGDEAALLQLVENSRVSEPAS